MPSARVKMVLGGRLQGVEDWSVSWHYAGEVGNQTTLDAYAAAVTTYITGSAASLTGYKAIMGSASTFEYIKCYDYAEGSIHADLVSEGTFHIFGTTPTMVHPLQIAAVATLRTPIPTRRTRGRMYWPAVGANLAQTAATQMSSANCDAIAAFTKALLALQGPDVKPCVFSRVAMNCTNISQITVDSRCDVQRSRANKQLPTSTSALAYP